MPEREFNILRRAGLNVLELTKLFFHRIPTSLYPPAWCYIGYFIDDIASQCQNLQRPRLYNVFSENEDGNSVNPEAVYDNPLMERSQAQSRNASQHPDREQLPKRMNQNLTRLGMSHCAISSSELLCLLHGSRTSLRELYLEYPMTPHDRDLLDVLRYVGSNLRGLSVHKFLLQLQEGDPPQMENLVDRILEYCPNLQTLDFGEAIGSPALLPLLLQNGKLRIWSFHCSAAVTAQHWLDALQHPDFKDRHASCRVYVKGMLQCFSF